VGWGRPAGSSSLRRVPGPTLHFDAPDGTRLAVHHLGGDGPPVLLVHATGFCGRGWAPVAAGLAPAYSVWAIDLRGHGRSERPATGRFDDWDAYVDDLLTAMSVVDAAAGARTGAGVPRRRWRSGGHSFGGGLALLTEARHPGTFEALSCYEPVVMPPGRVAAGQHPLAALARKRRPVFDSRRAAYDNYRSKPPFSAFTAEALWAYVENGLEDLPDGTVTLACRREDEAAVFEAAPANPVWGLLQQVRVPVTVMAGADATDPVARVAPDVAHRLPRGRYLRFADLDHFGPMTDPASVAAAMLRAFRTGSGQEADGPGQEADGPGQEADGPAAGTDSAPGEPRTGS
jgi:pimeloyl-ACP methyl ester carboxylesterase